MEKKKKIKIIDLKKGSDGSYYDPFCSDSKVGLSHKVREIPEKDKLYSLGRGLVDIKIDRRLMHNLNMAMFGISMAASTVLAIRRFIKNWEG